MVILLVLVEVHIGRIGKFEKIIINLMDWEMLEMARVLVVDDAAFMRMMLTNMLTKGGHEVIGQAENGKQAVEMYSSLLPDLVTMDITMPEMDGLEALKLIMAKDSNAKIVMCSAMGQQAMVLDAVKSGAKDFIVKPFEETKILETVNKVVG